LKKRTSINSIPQIHKEKEMADFRKWLYALAPVALLAGLTVPASAQSTIVCTVQSATDNLVRIEGLTEQVGDVLLACTGGTPTAINQNVPSVNIQLFLNLAVTSKITAVTGSASTGGTTTFDEALLIMDEPNSSLHPATPLLNCGNTGAPDTSLSGPGVCQITSDGLPIDTYNGTPGHPNVFQGRQALNSLSNNSVVFNSVPFDPPGSNTRFIRITNVRVDANALGVSAPTVQIPITMGIGSSGLGSLPLSFLSLTVATAQQGVTATILSKNLGFAQCVGVNTGLLTSAGVPKSSTTSTFASVGSTGTGVRFVEGFSNSWKVKNIAGVLANGTYNLATNGDAYTYDHTTTIIPANDMTQNVPGTNYYTESGFMSPGGTVANPAPNPPLGFQNFGGSGTTTTSGGAAFVDATTNIPAAGVASQGTRLAVSLQGVPNGLYLWVSPVIFLYRQGQSYATPDADNGAASGVMVLVATDGVTGANPGSGTSFAQSGTSVTSHSLFPVATSNGAALIVYEILFTDPFSNEYADVPIVVSYLPQLTQNAPIGLPQPYQIGTAAGGFAPFYTPPTGATASSSLPIPRFVFTGAYNPLLEVVKCSCNLLFPYVTQAPGYDTGIAIANTTADPYGTAGQYGAVTFNSYNGSTSTPIPQCTNTTSPGSCTGTLTTLGPGQVLTYTLYNGSTQWGLNNSAVGFTGYIIVQAQFQYCHAFAFIGGLGGGPAVNSTTNGLSEGYLALVLDAPLWTTPGARTGLNNESLGQ
jgi:hypothetical protein